MSETIGARVSDQLRDRIDGYADEHDLTRSEAIEILLRRGLGDDVEPEPPLQQRMVRLEDRVDSVEEQLHDLRDNPLGRLLQRL